MRSMDDELDFFFDKIMDSEPFALSRWGDGEYRLVNSIPLDRDAEHKIMFGILTQPMNTKLNVRN